MKNIHKFTVFIVFISIIFVAQAQEIRLQPSDGQTTTYTRCMETSGGIDSDVLDCTVQEQTVQKKRLKNSINKLNNYLTPKEHTQLVLSQRRWLSYKKTQCQLIYLTLGEGTASNLAAEDCHRQMTTQRVQIIEDIHTSVLLSHQPHK